MTEIRKDSLSGYWVIIAPGRTERPQEFSHRGHPREVMECPFCRGHEEQTPPAIIQYPPVDGKRNSEWQVRVIPNKYPVLDGMGQGQHLLAGDDASVAGQGPHEVIVESPRHVERFTQLEASEAKLAMIAYRDCFRRARSNSGLNHGLLFKNQGPMGGASLSHCHSQFVALPLIPPVIQQEINAFSRYHAEYSNCLFCSPQDIEMRGPRRIAVTENWYAIAPYASRFPYEIRLAPRRHSADFDDSTDEELRELSGLLKALLLAVETVTGQADYNFWIHSAPFRCDGSSDGLDPFDSGSFKHYHWHLEIAPRLSQVAGLEWGSGCFINPVSPEAAASELRQMLAANESR